MSLLIGFLTFVMVANCLFLILLVLVQLPKKEAGAGLAFGAGAVDTLIGAGSGNALTKLTKYCAGIFLGLAVVLAILNTQRQQSSTSFLKEELSRKTTTSSPMIPPQQPAAQPGASSGALPGTTTTPATTPATTPTAPASQNAAGPTFQLTPQPAQPNTTEPAPAQGQATPAPSTGTKQQP